MINKFFKGSQFNRDVSTLVIGTSVAQVIPVLLSPVISRIYSPEDIGKFTFFMSVVSFITIIATLRYELAILLPKNDETANSILILCIYITAFISFLTLVIELILMIFNMNFKLFYLAIPFSVFIISFYQIITNWKNRKKKYRQISISRMNNSIFNNAATLALGLLKFHYIGLIIGNIAGFLLSSFILVKTEFRELVSGIFKSKISVLKKTAIEYKEMPGFNSFQAMVDMYQVNGLVYFIPFFFGSWVLGLYALGIRVLQAPVNLVGSSIAQVFYQRASEKVHNNENIQNLIKGTIIKSACLALPIPVILFFAGQNIFAFVFGEQWRTAGLFATILSPWFFFDFVRMTISQASIIVNKQRQLLSISLIGTCILTLSVIYAGISKNITAGFYLISIFYSILDIYIIYWVYKISNKTNT